MAKVTVKKVPPVPVEPKIESITLTLSEKEAEALIVLMALHNTTSHVDTYPIWESLSNALPKVRSYDYTPKMKNGLFFVEKAR